MSEQNAQNNSSDNAPSWWIEENVPGVGERPSWLNEKFKSVHDMAKSYSELEKNFSQVPEKYDFSKSKYLDKDYVPFQELQELARNKRVPKEVMDKMVDSVDRYFHEFSTDPTEEMAKLGDNAKDRLELLNNWAKANLSDESFNALTTNMRTAETVKALEELRSKFMSINTNVPSGNNGGHEETSLEDLQAELNNNLDKFKTDPKYRKDLQGRMAAVASKSQFVDKNW